MTLPVDLGRGLKVCLGAVPISSLSPFRFSYHMARCICSLLPIWLLDNLFVQSLHAAFE